MTRKQYIEDIEYLINVLEEKHPNIYRNHDKEEFYKKICELKNGLDNITHDEFSKELALLLALFKDAHTTIRFIGKGTPIRFELLEEKLYITNINKEHSDALFKEVKFINEKTVADVLNELEKYTCYETEAFKNKLLVQRLRIPIILKKMDIIDAKYLSIKYKSDNNLYELKYNYLDKQNYNMINPLLGDNFKKNYDYKYFDDKKSLYIKYKLCVIDEDYLFGDFVKDIERELKNNPNKIIIDIRGNRGGNDMIIKPLINIFRKFKQNDGKLITLIDGGVFSGGTHALVDLINIGSYVVGTDTGGAMYNRFGQLHRDELPNSKIKFVCSTKTYNLIKDEEGNLEIIREGDFNTRPTFPLESFHPDSKVCNKIEDLREEIDTVLESALEYKKEKNIKNTR